MSIRKFSFLLLLPLSFLLSSCVENDKSLGEQFLSNDYFLRVKTVSFDNLPIDNKANDTIQGISNKNMLIGYLSDPIYGDKEFSSASIIVPLSDSTYFGINPILKDVYLTMVVDSIIYFDNSQEGIPQNVNIYKLKSDLDSTRGFNNSIKASDFEPIPVSVGSPTLYGKSTIKVNLSKEFGNELLSTTASEFADMGLFLERIKGLYVTIDPPENMQDGGRLNYMSLSSSIIYLDYYLTDPERDFVLKDTTETFLFGYIFCLNQYNVGSKHLENSHPKDTLYLDGLAGVKPHISAVELKNLLNKWIDTTSYDHNAVIVSRAYLELPYTMPDDFKLFNKERPGSIYPCTADFSAKDTMRFYTPVTDAYAVSSPGAINTSLQKYVCDITSYIQDLVSMEDREVSESWDLWITPLYLYSDSSNNSYYYFDTNNYNRVILNGPDPSVAGRPKPTLVLTYSLINY